MIFKKQRILPALCLAPLLGLTPSLASADVVGFEVGAGVWNQSPEGNLTYQGTLLDVVDDLGIGSESGAFFYAVLEHPIPVIPNIKVQKNSMEFSGTSTLTKDIVFGGTTYTISEDISSDIDLSHYDITLYYELLDNWVNLDLGINVKVFDGEATIRSATQGTTTTDLSFPIPLLYARGQFDLPFTGWQLEAIGQYVSYDGSHLSDFSGSINYTFAFGLGVKAGYRVIDLKIDDVDDITSDISIDGAFGTVFFDF